MPKVHRPLGISTPRERARLDREQRGTRSEQGYTNEWGRARKRFLQLHPLCVLCERRRRIVPANVVDHIQPHRSDQRLFWDEANWQALCAPCHDGPKKRADLAARRAEVARIALAARHAAMRPGSLPVGGDKSRKRRHGEAHASRLISTRELAPGGGRHGDGGGVYPRSYGIGGGTPLLVL